MRRIMSTVVMVGVLLMPAAALADEIQLEAGATFDGGICWEADGTEGLAAFDGQCVTPADYAEIYSFENLDAHPSQGDPSVSIAEAAGITADSPPADERLLGVGLVEEPQTFRQIVVGAHRGIYPI